MNPTTNALAAAAIPLLSSAVNAIPHTYLFRVPNDDAEDLEKQKDAELPSSPLQLVFLNAEDATSGQTKTKANTSQSQCVNTGSMTYYADEPIQDFENGLVLEDCDPSSADQTRVAYVMSKDLESSLAPTTIKIGCAGINTGKSSSPGDQDVVQLVFQKGHSDLGSSLEEDGKLQRRWESREDIELGSDGYYSCRSAESYHGSDSQPKSTIVDPNVCQDLQTVLEADARRLEKRDVAPNKKVKKPHQEGVSFQKRSNKKRLDNKVDAVPSEKLQRHTLDKARQEYRIKGKSNHAEFIKRWVKGDEHPRSFMAEDKGERLERRCNKHHDEEDYTDQWDDWERRSEDEKSHKSHDSHDHHRRLVRRCNKHKHNDDDYLDSWDDWERRSNREGIAVDPKSTLEKRCNKHHDGDCDDDCDRWEKRSQDDGSDDDDDDDERRKSRRSSASEGDASSAKSGSKRSRKSENAKDKRENDIYNDAAISKIQGHANSDYLGNDAFQKREEQTRRILAKADKWKKVKSARKEVPSNVKVTGKSMPLRRSIDDDVEVRDAEKAKRDLANDVWKYAVMPLLLRRREVAPSSAEVSNDVV